jgi:TolB-like protein/Flp pilus assembly protein TadD
MTAPAGSVIAFATSPGSTANDGSGKNSPYTSGLLAYLNDPGITAIQMFQKVTAYVLRKSNNMQLPWVSTSLTGDFYLVPGSGKADNTMVSKEDEDVIKVADKERSVAVLPFKNLTGKPDLDYLVQGQNEALITELSIISQVKSLRVLSGQTAARFVNASRSIPEIASEINVDYLMEGSVLGAGDSIILQLRLIQAFPEERPVWAKVYKTNIGNVYKMHSNIAGQIAGKIGLDLSVENLARLPLTRKVNPETYEAYTRGMYWLNQAGPDALNKGLNYLKEAVAKDPGDPYAYAYLALGYLDLAHGPNAPGDALVKAEAAALQAIRLDTTIAEVYSALAQMNLYSLWKFTDSEKYFKKALELNPNSAITHYHYSWGLYLWGRMDEAIAEHKLAQKYDPFNPQHTAWLGQLYLDEDRYNEAIEEANKSLEIQKDYPIGYLVLGRTYLETGRSDEAIEIHSKLAQLNPEWISELCLTYIKTGHLAEAEKILAEYEKRPARPARARNLTLIYAALGRKDEAFKWLAYEPHHAWVAFNAINPFCESLHGDPRWDEFLKKLNLPK